MRPLQERENSILRRLLKEEFQGRDEIAQQVANALVEEIDADGSVRFSITTAVRAEVLYRVAVEGWAYDSDGVSIHFLLHVVDGKVDELEVFKADGSRISKWPSGEDLEVFRPPHVWN